MVKGKLLTAKNDTYLFFVHSCTVNVVDLDSRRMIYSQEYEGRYEALTAHGTRYALLTYVGVTVVDFISKQEIYSSELDAVDALLFEDTVST